MKRDEQGYIVVETITSFLLLVLLMISILSLVNIVALQARIHYAITQAAETISLYSYTLEITGVANHLKANAGQAEAVQQESDVVKGHINQVIDGIYHLSGAGTLSEAKGATDEIVSGTVDTGSELYGIAESAVEDPKTTIQHLLNYGLNEVTSAAFGELIRPLVGRYLNNGSMTGDEYLRSAHVIGGLEGLEFYNFGLLATQQDQDGHLHLQTGAKNSTLMDSEGYVWINVHYQVDYTFGALPLPFGGSGSKLEISQTVATKAWLGGNGEGYQK